MGFTNILGHQEAETKKEKIQNTCAYWIELVRAKKLLMATPNGFVFPTRGLCLLLEMGL